MNHAEVFVEELQFDGVSLININQDRDRGFHIP
jgi:hypothetical protein